MSDADNQTGGSGDRFSKEDQDKGHRPPKQAEKDEAEGQGPGSSD